MHNFLSFKYIIDQAPGNIYWKDLEGKYIYCNLRFAKILGFKSVDDIINKTDIDLFGKDFGQKIQNNDQEIVKNNKAKLIEEIGVIADKKVTYISHKAPLLDEQMNIVGIFGVSIDITAQKDREEKLYFDNKLNTLTIENIIAKMPGHVYWKDKHGVYLGCNEKQAKSFGVKEISQVVGKTDYELLGNTAKANKIIEHDRRVINTGISKILEEQANFHKKDYVFLSSKSQLKDDDGQILGMVGVSIDITRQKELESSLYLQTQELRDALTEKQRFLNNLSHEIRTPLHVIKAISDELFESFDELSKSEMQSFIKTLVENNNRLMKLLTNLLDIAKGVQKKNFLNLEEIDIVLLTKECVNEVRQISSILFKTDKERINIKCDEIKISQVIRNLLDNAIKYGEKSDIIVEIKDFKDRIQISVIDHGIGVPKSERTKVFEPFFQSTVTRKTSGGTGLGLSICQEIIKAHQGKIWFDTKNQGQTCINVEIPYNL